MGARLTCESQPVVDSTSCAQPSWSAHRGLHGHTPLELSARRIKDFTRGSPDLRDTTEPLLPAVYLRIHQPCDSPRERRPLALKGDAADLDLVQRLVALVGARVLDGMDDVKARRRSSKDAATGRGKSQREASRRGEERPTPVSTHVCLLSSQGQGTQVRKNCEPLVLGPALAMLSV